MSLNKILIFFKNLFTAPLLRAAKRASNQAADRRPGRKISKMFCLGVNELSRRVYTKPISGKKWIHLEPVLTDFLASPGFILSVYGEAALSVRNIQNLKKLSKNHG